MEQKNIVTIQGVIGTSEIKSTGSVKYAKISVGVDRTYEGRDGQSVKETSWIPVTVFEGKGCPDVETLAKGAKVRITGRLRNVNFTAADGTDVRTWDVLAATAGNAEDNRHYAKADITGYVGNVRSGSAGDRAFANLSVATNHVHKDKGGEVTITTTWHRVTLWEGKNVKDIDRLSVGTAVSISGRIRTDSFTREDGSRMNTCEIVGLSLEIHDKTDGE